MPFFASLPSTENLSLGILHLAGDELVVNYNRPPWISQPSSRIVCQPAGDNLMRAQVCQAAADDNDAAAGAPLANGTLN